MSPRELESTGTGVNVLMIDVNNVGNNVDLGFQREELDKPVEANVSVLINNIQKMEGNFTTGESFDVPTVKNFRHWSGDLDIDSLTDHLSNLVVGSCDSLDEACVKVLNQDNFTHDESDLDSSEEILNFIIQNTERDGSGRLVMPLLWSRSKHLLAKNFNLSKGI